MKLCYRLSVILSHISSMDQCLGLVLVRVRVWVGQSSAQGWLGLAIVVELKLQLPRDKITVTNLPCNKITGIL